MRVALQMLLTVYTDWEPKDSRRTTPDQAMSAIHQIGGAVMPVEAVPEWVRLSMKTWDTESQGKPN